ncbi:MAG: glycosyltransferase family 25 protein [Chitinophagaceae bacterium]|nr:glycosyltransferase family 25 protein [Chitinophagaceae bacterium]
MNADFVNINHVLKQNFDKIFVVTVSSFTERQEKMKQKLQGIDFEFFFGVHKDEITDDFMAHEYVYDKKNTLSPGHYFKPMTKSEMACALSHRRLYEHIIEQGIQKSLILEDDAIPAPENLQLLNEYMKHLPNDWEFLYFGYWKYEKRSFSYITKNLFYRFLSLAGLSKMHYEKVKNMLPRPYNAYWQKSGLHDYSHAYALTYSGACKLKELQTPLKFRSDNAFSALILENRLRAFTPGKIFFYQDVHLDKQAASTIR